MSNKANEMIQNMSGEKGYIIISDTSEHTGNYCAVMPLTEVVINSITTKNSSGGSGKTLPIGVPLLGITTSITLTSGTAILYKA